MRGGGTMDIKEYFKGKLVEIKENGEISRLFARADKKECERSLQSDSTLFHNQAVMSYYDIAKGTLENFIETGVYAYDDITELAGCLYKYYLALRFAANNCDSENMKFEYNKEDIDCIVTNFMKLGRDIVDYNMRKMMND